MADVHAMADDAEPGAPVPKDAIDPELVSLRPRTQVGLITALSVVVFCVYLALRLWPDFEFAGEGAAREVTVAEVRDNRLADQSFVKLRADLERAGAVRVRVSKGVPGLRVVPVVGGGDRVWVVLDGDGWSSPRAEPSYTGRLRRLDTLPFEEPFLAQVRAHPHPRFITALDLRQGREAGDQVTLTAVSGDTFAIEPDDEVEIVVPDPDAATVAASFGERLPDAEAWSTALAAIGLVAPGAQPAKRDDQQAWFDVRRPGALADTAKILQDAGLWGARVESVTREYRAGWRAVRVDETGVTLGGAHLPWSAVDVVAVHAARPLVDNPWIVIVGDAPGNYWYVRPLYVLIALFGVLFTWALIRTARRELLSPKVPTPASE